LPSPAARPRPTDAGEMVIRGYRTAEIEARQVAKGVAHLLGHGYSPRQIAVLYRTGAVGLAVQLALQGTGSTRSSMMATGCRSGATLCARRGLRLQCPLLGDRRHGGHCGSPQAFRCGNDPPPASNYAP
jgi:hypothetical protein